jgi:hypothetical protein
LKIIILDNNIANKSIYSVLCLVFFLQDENRLIQCHNKLKKQENTKNHENGLFCTLELSLKLTLCHVCVLSEHMETEPAEQSPGDGGEDDPNEASACYWSVMLMSNNIAGV